MSLNAATCTACESDFTHASSPELPAAAMAERGVLDVRLPMRHAGIRRVRVDWEWQGAAQGDVLIVQGGIHAHRHVAASTRHVEAGWWQNQCGPGLAIDTRRHRVLSIDWLGHDGTLDVCIDPADQADALAAVLDHLRVGRIKAFIGASYGAMVGLQFAARHAHRLAGLIALGAAHRAHPASTALRLIQRRIVALGRSECGIRKALTLAHALERAGQRGNSEFVHALDQAPQITLDALRLAFEDHLDSIGPELIARTCATAWLRLSESIDLQQLAPESITVPTELVAVIEDPLVPLADVQALAQGIAAPCRLHSVHSPHGHDAFLKEDAAISRILSAALENLA